MGSEPRIRLILYLDEKDKRPLRRHLKAFRDERESDIWWYWEDMPLEEIMRWRQDDQ